MVGPGPQQLKRLCPWVKGAPFVNLKAILRLLLYFVDGKTESHFAGAIEKLKLMVADETAKLATLAESRR
jgi:hypothetical protein